MAKFDLGVKSLPELIRVNDTPTAVTNKPQWRSEGIGSKLKELCISSATAGLDTEKYNHNNNFRSASRHRSWIYVVNDKGLMVLAVYSFLFNLSLVINLIIILSSVFQFLYSFHRFLRLWQYSVL